MFHLMTKKKYLTKLLHKKVAKISFIITAAIHDHV